MDFQRGNISIWLAISTIILSTGLVSHVMALPVILNVAGRDSWVSVLIAAPFFIFWIYIYFRVIHKLDGRSFIDFLDQHWGKIATWCMKIVFACILFFNALYTVIDTMMWTNSTYLQQTPIAAISLVMLLLCFGMAISGLQSIAVVSSILLPLVTFLGYFVSFSNTKYKDMSLLFPIFDHGYTPAIHGSFYVLSSLMDIWIMILFAHHIKKKFTKIQLLLLALFFLMIVIGPITGGITEFGPTEAIKQRHTTFDQWKILSLGELMQHVDFLSIYQWLSGSIIRTAISLYLMIEVFQFKKNKQRTILLSILSVILFGLLFLRWREDLMLHMLQNIYFPLLASFVLVLTFAIIFTQWIVQRKELGQHGS